MSFKVYIDEIVNKFSNYFKPAPSPISSVPADIIARIFSLLNDVDASHLEQASKHLYAIASNPINGIHTPLRLTYRDFCLNLNAQIEKMSKDAEEIRQLRIPHMKFNASSRLPREEYSIKTSLGELVYGFAQYFDQLKVEGKEAKLSMYADALTKLITRVINKDATTKFGINIYVGDHQGHWYLRPSIHME